MWTDEAVRAAVMAGAAKDAPAAIRRRALHLLGELSSNEGLRPHLVAAGVRELLSAGRRRARRKETRSYYDAFLANLVGVEPPQGPPPASVVDELL
eukprot:1180813-Prymnesium_polylepis.1